MRGKTTVSAKFIQEQRFSCCIISAFKNFGDVPNTTVPYQIFLSDAARGLAQQMVFWGHDARHPGGNSLVRFGMERSPSPGLTGTSCYSMPWENGLIELHGAVASWTPPPGGTGCVFCRDLGSIALWNSPLPPVPGREHGVEGSADERWLAFLPFIRWLLAYEPWIHKTHGSAWRAGCWRALKRLPKGKPWLPPHLALKWWELAAAGNPPRAKALLKTNTMGRKPLGARSAGFTLVELLVVISIIAALALVATFAARSVVLASKQAACTSNLRNIGLGLRLYAQDHDGRFPETTHTSDLDAAWIYSLKDYLGDFEQGRICPADPKGAERRKAKGTSYVLNSYIFVPEIGPFGDPVGPQLNRPQAIPEPSRTMMAFVCSDSVGTGPGNDHTHSNQWSSWPAVCRDISPDRFGGNGTDHVHGSSNYLFVDGRVESIRALDLKKKIEAGINVAKPPGIEGLP
jgi:prepilin-type N-terminal cleavage/methylation domain-containing protein/prepilin-type processing-associated H-X9-DG protein